MFAEAADLLRRFAQFELVADPRISAGGVKVVTRQGVIDATVECQLSNAARALLGRPVRRASGTQAPEPMGQYVPVSGVGDRVPLQTAAG